MSIKGMFILRTYYKFHFGYLMSNTITISNLIFCAGFYLNLHSPQISSHMARLSSFWFVLVYPVPIWSCTTKSKAPHNYWKYYYLIFQAKFPNSSNQHRCKILWIKNTPMQGPNNRSTTFTDKTTNKTRQNLNLK